MSLDFDKSLTLWETVVCDALKNDYIGHVDDSFIKIKEELEEEYNEIGIAISTHMLLDSIEARKYKKRMNR